MTSKYQSDTAYTYIVIIFRHEGDHKLRQYNNYIKASMPQLTSSLSA